MTKPLGRKSYGSIPHLPGSKIGPSDHGCHHGQHRICCVKARDAKDTIIVQEKLDGSNVAAARIGDEIVALQRKGYLCDSSPHEQHHRFARFVESRRDVLVSILEDGERLCGEWLAMAHGTKYDLRCREPFVAFDIIRGHQRVGYSELLRRVGRSFSTPPCLHIGCPVSTECAMAILGEHGYYGAEKAEGVVYRVERDGEVDFLAKFVRADFEPGKYFGDTPVWNLGA